MIQHKHINKKRRLNTTINKKECHRKHKQVTTKKTSNQFQPKVNHWWLCCRSGGQRPGYDRRFSALVSAVWSPAMSRCDTLADYFLQTLSWYVMWSSAKPQDLSHVSAHPNDTRQYRTTATMALTTCRCSPPHYLSFNKLYSNTAPGKINLFHILFPRMRST